MHIFVNMIEVDDDMLMSVYTYFHFECVASRIADKGDVSHCEHSQLPRGSNMMDVTTLDSTRIAINR